MSKDEPLSAAEIGSRRWIGLSAQERAAIARKGGQAGGRAAWAKLSPEERSAEMRKRAARRKPADTAGEIGGMYVRSDDSWSFEITDFAALLNALSEPVVAAFCRCFVHGDRLTALSELGAFSAKQHGENSVAHTRNLHAMFWLVVGTLRELGAATSQLRAALKRVGLLDETSNAWRSLEEIEGWQTDKRLRNFRNKVAFHVDAEVIRRGIGRLTQADKVIVARGDSRKQHTTELTLGMDALIRGLDLPEGAFPETIALAARHQQISSVLQELFLDVLYRSGGSFGKGQSADPGPPYFVNEYVPPADARDGAVAICEVHNSESIDSPGASILRQRGYEERGHGQFHTLQDARARCTELGYTLKAIPQPHAVERWMRPLQEAERPR